MKERIKEFKNKLEDLCIHVAQKPYIYEYNSCSPDIVSCPCCENRVKITLSIRKQNLSNTEIENLIKHEENCHKMSAMKLLDEFEDLTKDVIFVPQMKGQS